MSNKLSRRINGRCIFGFYIFICYLILNTIGFVSLLAHAINGNAVPFPLSTIELSYGHFEEAVPIMFLY
ncbi:hypothetical protein [Sediminicola arcticus]|uniref:Uncharacterized protein n=1 Tax=Sediminicola arcticus TaxID=1574308 RepID=A0ABV2SY42_9FLAO